MRFFFFFFLYFLFYHSLPAQVQAKKYELGDSTEALRLLREGNRLMQGEKTKIIAAQYFGDVFRLSQAIGFYRGEGEALRALALLDVRDKHQYSLIAMDYFKKSLDVWERHQDIYEIAHTFVALGDAFSERWHAFEESLAYYKQALILTERLQRNSETQQLRLKIFKIHIENGDIHQATQYSNPLLIFYEKQGFHEAIAQIKLDIAQYWASQKAFEKAKEIAQEAQKSFQAHGGNPKQFDSYFDALKQNQAHTNTIEGSRISLMIFTVLVLLVIFILSYFYARRQVSELK